MNFGVDYFMGNCFTVVNCFMLNCFKVDLINKKQWVQAFQLFDGLLNGDLSGHKSYYANATGR